MESNIRKLACKSVEHFDNSTQDLILIEEMSELTKALLKHRRGASNMDEIREELAHVVISTHVARTILGITEQDLETEATKKLAKYGWDEMRPYPEEVT